MPRITKGIEYDGVPEVVPGGISIPKAQPRGIANQGQGTSVVTPPLVVYDSIRLLPISTDAVTTNIAGNPTDTASLDTVNIALATRVVSYPGSSTDDNNTQWEVPVPYNMDTDAPDVTIRLHIVILS